MDRFVVQPVLAFERNYAGAFYAIVFAISLEMAGLFADLREAIRHSRFLLHIGLFKSMFLVAIIAVLAAALFRIFRHRVTSIGTDSQASGVGAAFSEGEISRPASAGRWLREAE